MLYGRDVVLPTDLIFGLKKGNFLDTTDEKLNYKFDLGFRLKHAYERLVEKKKRQSDKYKAFYYCRHRKVEFKEGDLVSVYWPTPVKGMSKKFCLPGVVLIR